MWFISQIFRFIKSNLSIFDWPAMLMVGQWLYFPNFILFISSWWRHQMEIYSALLAICAGNTPVTGEFPAQRPVTRSFDVFFDLRVKKRLSKQSRGWSFETLSRPLWRHCNVFQLPPSSFINGPFRLSVRPCLSHLFQMLLSSRRHESFRSNNH